MGDARNEQRKLAAIMFTDMVGYSALTQRNESLALEVLEEHRRLLRDLFPQFDGREVETTGDGFLVEFGSALEASKCAIEIQRAISTRNLNVTPDRQIQVRIGIHVGDVVHKDGHVLGDGVNIAARLQPLAEPGGICISVDVARQVQNNLQAAVARVGEAELKNIRLPMEIFRIVLPWQNSEVVGQAQPAARSARPLGEGRSLKNKVLLAVAVLVFLNLLVATVYLSQQKKSSGGASTNSLTHNAPSQKSVAVLPFVNMGADKADEYLSDGMTEELLNALAKVPGLRVPGRSSSFAFKGKNEEGIFRTVGEKLHVATVLEGSVRKVGSQLRVTVQLINVADGFHLWSETYDRDMTNILAIQRDIAVRAVTALKGQLGMEETRALATKSTDNPEAYRLYLMGRYYFAKQTVAGQTDAIRHFNQALQLDPSFALAYCGLADTHAWMGSRMPGKDARAIELEMARKAVRLDPDLADAHLSLAMAHSASLDWESAEKEIRRALELNPNLALAHHQVSWLRAVFGRFELAIASSKRAVELDPLSPFMNVQLGWRFYQARRYDEAIRQARKTLELDANTAGAHSLLGWCFLWQGTAVGAVAEFEQAKLLDPQFGHDVAISYVQAISGNRADAEQTLRRVEDMAKQQYVSPAWRVTIYLGLGETNKALDWLEKSYEVQDAACWYLKINQLYDGMRKEARFQALMKKAGLDK